MTLPPPNQRTQVATLFDVTVSAGKSVKNHVVSPVKLDIALFQTPHRFIGSPKDKDGPYYTAARFAGHVRGTAHTVDVPLIVLDIDTMVPDALVHARHRLRLKGYEHLRHITTQHTRDAPRMRFLLRPDRALSPHEYRHLVPKLAEEFGFTIDLAGLNAAQPMFFPLLPDGKHFPEPDYREGVAVPVDTYLADCPPAPAVGQSEEDDSELFALAVPAGLTQTAWLAAVCQAYPAKGLDYDAWVRFGMALHHQSGGEGFGVWHEWTKGNPDYTHDQVAREKAKHQAQWRSFGGGEGTRRITLKSILNQRRAVGGTVLSRAYTLALGMMEDEGTIGELYGHIARDTFLASGERSQVANAYRRQIKAITGETITQAHAMMAMKSAETPPGEANDYFAQHYVWDQLNACYIHLLDKRDMSIASMDYAYGHKMPPGSNGEPKRVHTVLSKGLNQTAKPRMVIGRRFAIGQPPLIDTDEGSFLNTYIPERWPTCGAPFRLSDPIDREVALCVERHLRLLSTGDEQVATALLHHLAHLRQHPTVRIKWGFAISSFKQGIGKSTLRELYAQVLGPAHVAVLSPDNIAEQYNEYGAAPKLMSFIEEFEFDSYRAKNAAVKRLKNMMTSDTVAIRRMHRAAMEEPATTSYAIFSNDDNVLGVEGVGRRWMPITMHSFTEEQVERHLDMDRERFFNDYYQLLMTHPDRFIAYVESIDVAGFNPNVAPETQEKKTVVAASPVSATAQLIEEFIADKRSLDLTQHHAYIPSIRQLLLAQSSTSTDAQVQEITDRPVRRLEAMIAYALKSSGYVPLSAYPRNDGQEVAVRNRLRFDAATRPYVNATYVRDKPGHTYEQQVRHVSRALAAARKGVEEGDGELSPEIKNIDGTPFNGEELIRPEDL